MFLQIPRRIYQLPCWNSVVCPCSSCAGLKGNTQLGIGNTPVRVGTTINLTLIYPPKKNMARDQGLECFVLSYLDLRGGLWLYPEGNYCLFGLDRLSSISQRATEDPDGFPCLPRSDFLRRTDWSHTHMAVVQSIELHSKVPGGEDAFLPEWEHKQL